MFSRQDSQLPPRNRAIHVPRLVAIPARARFSFLRELHQRELCISSNSVVGDRTQPGASFCSPSVWSTLLLSFLISPSCWTSPTSSFLVVACRTEWHFTQLPAVYVFPDAHPVSDTYIHLLHYMYLLGQITTSMSPRQSPGPDRLHCADSGTRAEGRVYSSQNEFPVDLGLSLCRLMTGFLRCGAGVCQPHIL
jgi:hypothetical protein